MLMLTGITPIGLAYASKPMSASGTVILGDVIEVLEVRTAGGNTFITQIRAVELTGTITASDINLQMFEIHPNGAMNFQEWITGTGTVEGVGTGTITSRLQGYVTPSGNVEGTVTILSGTGDLENLRGTFKIGGTIFTGMTYSGQMHVDP